MSMLSSLNVDGAVGLGLAGMIHAITPELLLFYMMAFTMIGSAIVVVSARNPVHSVLFLILAFLNAAGLFILQGAEFVAMIVAIVYVGAVAILFLFVVMMFDGETKVFPHSRSRYKFLGAGLLILLGTEILASMWLMNLTPDKSLETAASWSELPIRTNTEGLGSLLYTEYFLPFQLAGVVLLVAMIGAIVLTFKKKSSMRHQDARVQGERHPENTLRLEKVAFRQGVKL